MNFISNGDYNFPFDVHYYWLKLVYMWSYQTGAPNPDGVIRMPGRLIDLAVFALTNNIFISAFYLLTCFAIVFVAFYYFSKLFLNHKSKLLSAVAALFFTINPIFLGNASKIGLVLAAAMLPLCFVAIKKAFEKQQFRYFLLWIACLNISLIHPFTFTVNLIVSGGYLLYMAHKNRPFITGNIPKVIIVGLMAVLLNAYFLMPLASIGTVNKDVLSASVDATPTDYTSLIEVANTGDIFTGLSLAKGVLKDYEFFNDGYQLLYFLGIFSFYILLFAVYVRIEKRLSIADRKYFAWALAAFLLLVLLAAVNYLYVKDIIKLVVNLPGGWIFRSPLKWQLYIPFAIATMLAIVLAYVPNKRNQIKLYAGLGASFILMNAFIGMDVYNKLLMPRSMTTFSALQETDLNQKSLLLINDPSCFSFAAENPRIMTELNQILVSKNVQVKQMGLTVADTVNLSSYDYILGCQNIIDETLQQYDFTQEHSFADNAFQLYKNEAAKPYIYANQNMFSFEKPQQIGNKYDFVTRTLGKDFDFINTPNSSTATTYSLQDTYENVGFHNMSGGSINVTAPEPKDSGKQSLYFKSGSNNLYFSLSGNQLSLSPEEVDGYQPLGESGEDGVIDVEHNDALNVSYTDPRYDYQNILPNPSLEQGLWQETVGDCYAYGDDAKINMHANKADKTDGSQSLQLEAQNHVACTGPANIPVEAEQNYLLSFDYKSVNGRFAAYHVSFDDEAETSYLRRLNDTKGEWSTITKSIAVPAGAKTMKLLFYAYPDTSGLEAGIARYDNFKLTAIPDVQNHFYLLSEPSQTLQQPQKVSYNVINPTKTTIQVEGVRSPFYLETKESYSPRWKLSMQNTGAKSWWPFGQAASVPESDHLKINNFMNGWLVDPNKFCESSCKQNSDGSYTIKLVMEFVPQQWFYVGGAISGATFLAAIGYLVYDEIRRRSHSGSAYTRRRR
jgi:hypothetical protein